MERLTYFRGGRWWINLNGCEYGGFPEIDRLAAYEDTGLTPEEIAIVINGAVEEFSEYDELMPKHRIKELAQAEKDGRLVVLPPNDPLTLEELREMIGSMVQCGSVDGQFFGRMLVGMNGCVICDSFDFADYGKTWLAYRRKPEEDKHGMD